VTAWLRLFRRRLNLRSGTDAEATVERVSEGAILTPDEAWLLMCSAVLASIGLDTGSAAVVIGAMLISPLMGPILGVGLGMGITDRRLLYRSLRELAIATLFCLGASTLYFLLSPLATPTQELMARTHPTLLDVGVAFFGGLAGIVAGSRRDIGLALPGVAIATALMPPLCTAGFGLATVNWGYFLGAFYLYALNGVFIALATFLTVRLLRFPHHVGSSPEDRRREQRMVAIVAILAALPSTYFLYQTASRLRQDARIGKFIEREVERPGRAVTQWEVRRDDSGEILTLYVVGQSIDDAAVDSLAAELAGYRLGRLRLDVVQSDVSGQDLARLQGEVRLGILRAITAATGARDSVSTARARADSVRISSVARELASAFPEIEAVAYTRRLNMLAPDSVRSPRAFLVTFAEETRARAQRDILVRARALVRTRLDGDSILVVVR
jgi:uncharacterized hydrophobic protein (TIGR00271 family)